MLKIEKAEIEDTKTILDIYNDSNKVFKVVPEQGATRLRQSSVPCTAPGRERLSSPQEMAWHRHALCKTKPLLPCCRADQMYLIVGRNNLTALSSYEALFSTLNQRKYFLLLAL